MPNAPCGATTVCVNMLALQFDNLIISETYKMSQVCNVDLTISHHFDNKIMYFILKVIHLAEKFHFFNKSMAQTSNKLYVKK